MLIAGPLIRVLGDRYGWNVKVATLEALVELVRKVQYMSVYVFVVVYCCHMLVSFYCETASCLRMRKFFLLFFSCHDR